MYNPVRKQTQGKLIIIADWHNGGHNATYLLKYSEAILATGNSVAVVCTPSLAEQIRAQLANTPVELDIFEIKPVFVAKLGKTLRDRLNFITFIVALFNAILKAESQKGIRASLIFFCCVWDNNTAKEQAIMLLMNRNFACMYLHPRVFLQKSAATKTQCEQFGRFLASKRLKSIAVLNEDIVDRLRSSIGKRVLPFPDIANIETGETNELGQKLKAFAQDRFLVIMIGHLVNWKGVTTVAKAAEKADGKTFAFAFLGPLEESSFSAEGLSCVRNAMRLPHCYFYNRRIPDGAEYNSAIIEADLICAPYIQFPFSSNTLTKCAYFRKPIIVSENGIMAQRVLSYDLGYTIPETDAQALLESIESIHKGDEMRRGILGYDKYYDQHNSGMLIRRWKELLGDHD